MPLRHAYLPHDTVIPHDTLMKDGSSVKMAVFGREGLFGLVSAVVTHRSLGRYVVQLTGTASRIDIDHMQEAIATRPGIRRLFLHYTEALMTQVFQSVACNAVHGAEARCCRWILSMHDRLDRDALPLTHEFLAKLLGVQRSTLSIITRHLQTAGLIRQARGVITVTDRVGLEGAACECYGRIHRTFEELLLKTYARDWPWRRTERTRSGKRTAGEPACQTMMESFLPRCEILGRAAAFWPGVTCPSGSP
jgi:hypothetical protein